MRSFVAFVGLSLSLACGCKNSRADIPTSCSSAVCVGGEVELNLASAVPSLGEAGRVVLVEEGEHGTALVGVVGQDGERRLLGLAMVSIDELKAPEVAARVAPQLSPGKALLWVIEGGRRSRLDEGELRFSLDPRARQLKATLRSADLTAAVDGRYRLECKVPESVLNVQLRGVNAPGSETYAGDPGLDSDFCQKFRSLR